uniref:Uncharacterized protein n=1 Tax=Timema monikensis TaxID=170555 RepID=A0A7R9E645_9NEOP|nr:unnamed protein product [Timema monikensis]
MAQEPDDINLTNQELQVLSELDSRLFGFLKLNSPEQSKKKELVLKAVKYLECMLVQAQKEKEHRQHIEKREIVWGIVEFQIVEKLKNLTLKRAWNRINGTSTKEQLELEKSKERANELEQEVRVDNIVNIAKRISGFSECDVGDVEEWLLCDPNDQGFQVMTEDKNLESVVD